MPGNRLTGAYCYDLALKAVDYYGNIARNRKNRDTSNNYSPEFSPNNIRRVIICPHKVVSEFHVGVDKGKSRVKSLTVPIPSEVLRRCVGMEDYKPLIGIIADHICSSIEEVVLCGMSVDKQFSLSQKDLDWACLVRSYKGASSNLVGTFISRYKRLRYIVVLPTFSFQDLVQAFGQDKKYFFGDVRGIRETGKVMDFNKVDEWYTKWGTSSAYAFDAAGGRLNNHFKEEKEKREKALKDGKAGEMSAQRLGGLRKEFCEALSSYQSVLECDRMLQAFSWKAPSVMAERLGVTHQASEPVQLYRCKEAEGYPRLAQQSVDGKKALEENLKLLKKAKTSVYCAIAEEFFRGLSELGKTCPMSLSVFMENCGRAVTVPPQMEGMNQEIKRLAGYGFEGARFQDSLANLCAYYVTLFVSDQSGKPTAKYREKVTWMGVLDND